MTKFEKGNWKAEKISELEKHQNSPIGGNKCICDEIESWYLKI